MCVAAWNRTNILKPHIFGFQGRSRSSMLVSPESASAVSFMRNSKSVSICNLSHNRLVDSSRNRAFWKRYPHLTPAYGRLFERRGSKLRLLNSTLNGKNSYVGCLGLSLVISAQFTLEMCVAARNRKKVTKFLYLGGLRLFKIIDVSTAGKAVNSACYDT